MVEDVRELFEVVGRDEAVEVDGWDVEAFGSVADDSDVIASRMSALDAAGFNGRAAMQDLFAAHYKRAPRLTDADLLSPGGRVVRAFVEQLMQSPEYRALHHVTALDRYHSALAAVQVAERLEQVIREQQDLADAMRRAQQDPGDAEVQAALDQAIQDMRAAIQVAAKQAARKAADEAAEEQAILGGWGLTPGDLREMPFDRRRALLDALRRDPRVREMARLVGRLRAIAARAKVKALSPDEVANVVAGREIERALPVELARLHHPVLRVDAIRRLCEGDILRFELRSREREAKGPMVVLMDRSGSTRQNGTWAWIRAVTLTLAEIAVRERRTCVVLPFNERVGDPIYLDGDRRRLPQRILELVSVPVGGGTDWDAAVSAGLAIIQQRSEMRRADLVLITDGVAEFRAVTRESLGERVRMFGVVCGGSRAEVERGAERLRGIADEAWAFEGVPDTEDAEPLFERVWA